MRRGRKNGKATPLPSLEDIMSNWTKILSGRREVIIPLILIASVAGFACYRFLSKDELPTRVPDLTAITTQVREDPLRTSPLIAEQDNQILPPAPKRFTEVSLTPAEVERFLAKHHRDGPSLIAAFSMLDDPRYLKEAIEKAPELPEVALVALALGAGGPDEGWIQRLRSSDPDNSLVQFLSSYEALTRQDGTMAFEAMKKAQTLPEFDDYSGERMRLIEEAYLDAGYSQEKASALAAKSPDPTDALLPKYLKYAELVSSHLSNYRNRPEEVDWMLQAALKLGDELMKEREGKSLFIQAGGALYEQALYEGILESAPFPSLAKPPGTLAAEALDYKGQLVALKKAFNSANWLNNQSDEAVVGFFKQKREQGELAALMSAVGLEDR
jgi:hypothetical protein